ncbi:MAG: alpha/beta hydrolase [Deltaproteobacteria bacterium]|nr:MAG: alpha/beta hydrolase [Deltaproteobacteria bacterium]
MAVEHRFVETNGVRLHCAVDGDGPLVILLHGFPECWYSWRHQIAALAPRFRVVAPDLRGYNESDKPEGIAAYALPELVADVRGLIEAFGEREAAIVGHDWGGAIAWTFAMDHPEATRRLVVLNCPHPAIFAQHLRANGRQLARSWYMFFFQLPWLPEAVLRAGHGWAVGSAIRRSAVRQDAITTQDLGHLRDAVSRPGAMRSAVNYYRAAFRSPDAAGVWPDWLSRFVYGDRPPAAVRRTLEDWPKITAPTLLVWGEADVALGKELTLGMEPLFRGPFDIKYVPLSGHWVQQEQPELVNGYLLDFLGDLAPAQPGEPLVPA